MTKYSYWPSNRALASLYSSFIVNNVCAKLKFQVNFNKSNRSLDQIERSRLKESKIKPIVYYRLALEHNVLFSLVDSNVASYRYASFASSFFHLIQHMQIVKCNDFLYVSEYAEVSLRKFNLIIFMM
jgi:hypothetical protein